MFFSNLNPVKSCFNRVNVEPCCEPRIRTILEFKDWWFKDYQRDKEKKTHTRVTL